MRSTLSGESGDGPIRLLADRPYDVGLASAATVVSVGFLFAPSIVSLQTLERGIHYES
jgi:hypothetical protein